MAIILLMTISLHAGLVDIILKDNQLLVIHNAKEDDYWKLSSEDIKVEYSRGRLFIHTPASIKHEEIFGILYLTINNYLNQQNLGKMLGSRVALKLPNGHRPEPDLLYIESDQYDRDKDIILESVPRWVIEIISPSTRDHDFGEKLEWYKESGVDEIWLVDSKNRELIIHKRSDTAYSKQSLKEGSVSPLDFNDFIFDVTSLWL